MAMCCVGLCFASRMEQQYGVLLDINSQSVVTDVTCPYPSSSYVASWLLVT